MWSMSEAVARGLRLRLWRVSVSETGVLSMSKAVACGLCMRLWRVVYV